MKNEIKKKVRRAVYYERVSTIDSSQDESMENQRKLLKSYCKRHPEIDLVETFSERISAKSDERRQYQAMISRIKAGDIDLILVKDLKRLNRSQELSAELKNFAKDYQFTFVLLGTGQEYDPNASETRMMYGFESLVNEEVVYRQSEYGRLAHRQKMESGRLNRNNVTFGYSWSDEKKDIIINESQADIIRNMFDLYVFQDYGTKELMKYLYSQGVSRSDETIRKWLSETAFIGVFHMNKKGSELGVGKGRRTRRFTNPVDEWVAVNRPDLAIVSKEVFELAQEIKSYRISHCRPDLNGKKQGRFRGTHLFSSRLFCAECGRPYVHGYADRSKKIGIYRITQSRKTSDLFFKCPNVEYHRVYEEDLKSIIITTINTFPSFDNTIKDDLISAIRKVLDEATDNTEEIAEHERVIKQLSNEQKDIMKTILMYSGELRHDLEEKYNTVSKLIQQKKEQLSSIKDSTMEKAEMSKLIKDRIKTIQDALLEYSDINENDLSREVLSTFLKRIIIDKDGNVDILLNTGQIQRHTVYGLEKRNPKEDSSFLATAINNINRDICPYRINMLHETYKRSVIEESLSTDNLYLFSFKYYSNRQIKNSETQVYIVNVFSILKPE